MWVDNITMDLEEVGWADVDWIDLRVPLNAGKLSSGLTSSGLSVSVQLHIVS
jgi:hypothetical protein